ncbi:MAG: hypothetical protein K2J74_05010, partial [Muribaculaceae bacterium]|nr:hypothetical protein [Muribaculaceae bacterium]
YYIIAIFVISTTFISCGVVKTGSNSNNAYQAPSTYIESNNDYALDVDSKGVSYTIDISTPEGASKLNKISLKEAEKLALTEAVIKYNCAMLINPQFTNLMNRKRVLRITVFGFPARYRARPDKTYDSNSRQQIDINVNK